MKKLEIVLLNTATLILETEQEGEKVSEIDVLKVLRDAYREGKLEKHILAPEYFDEIDSDWEAIDEVYMEIDHEVYMFGFRYIALYDETGKMLSQVEYK